MIDRLDIHAWVDGELGESEQRALSQAVQADPALRAEFHAIVLTKRILKSKAEVPDCREAWRRCRPRLREIERDRKIEHFVGRRSWALCGAFALALVVGHVANRTLGSGLIRPSDVASMSSMLVPVPQPQTSEPEKLRQWAASAIGDAPMNLQPGVCQVRGIFAGYGKDRRMIKLLLRDNLGDFTIIAVSGASSIDKLRPLPSGGELLSGTLDGKPCVAWMDSGYALFVVGNRDYDSLARIAASTKVR
ncbi:MAG: hypothetical protein N2109_00080 [Fimbriimonadales bacterium]|nr:hypothetical protein [Fimbriimonadales bacterium]